MDSEHTIVTASAAGLSVRSAEDIAGVLGALYGADGLFITEDELGPAVFDLHSGLAGELFQKLVTYRISTALLLRDPQAHGPRFAELAFEHARHPTVRFFTDEARAWAWLRDQKEAAYGER